MPELTDIIVERRKYDEEEEVKLRKEIERL